MDETNEAIDWDTELRRWLDGSADHDRRARAETRLLWLMAVAVVAGILLMAAAVAMASGGAA